MLFCDKTNADGVSLHKFPRDVNLCLKWNQFVLRKRDRKMWTPGHGHICSGHFTPSDYEGYAAKLTGFTSRLVLKKGAIPSIQPIPTPEQLQKPFFSIAIFTKMRPRLDILDTLDVGSVLVVLDWAMKFLPRKYCESQADWLGERGISWHVSVAMTKSDGQIQMLTLVHIFQSCNQA
ncbi:hypothetical protein QZH41_014862 [Actinostola sp. cb2023]|nr:hypothetical protein QZH41_014862 [Actinostola sp. cb2023]